MKTTRKTMKTLLAGASMLGLTSAAMLGSTLSADATTVRFANGLPPGSGPSMMLDRNTAATLEETGLNVRQFHLTLLSLAEANAGIRDGVADMGWNLYAYFPSDFPANNMAAEFSQLVELEEFSGELQSLAFGAAITEYMLFHCPECVEELAAQEQVFLGAGMTTNYALQCMMPIETAADLEGKRIRAAGAFWSRWIESVGATPVSMSINETLEALNQGVVDCTASNTADFVNFGLIDVVRHVHDGLPGALFTIPLTINIDSWQSLTDEERGHLLRYSANVSAGITWTYIGEARDGRERAPGLGITYDTVSEELLAMNRAFIDQDLDVVAEVYRERFGIENGEEVAATIRELLERWTALVADVSSEEEAVELYYNEIFSRIDPATFRM